jgi:hypothetical protein
MAAKDSYLSSQRYGYDIVVATTQASINAAMKTFLDNLEQPLVNVCFVADGSGNPVRIDFNDVLKACDPFAISANVNPDNDPNLKKLFDMRFLAGFRVRLGIPASIHDPRKVPDLVVLGNETAAVTFNLLCSEFEIVELSPGGYTGRTWAHLSQSDGDPWLLKSRVDLRMANVQPNHYNTLPPAVQLQIKNLTDAFSIRQLLFDFTNAGLSTVPTIEGIQSGTKLHALLQQYFVGAYFSQLQAKGEPVLSVAITRENTATSSLAITDFNLQVSPYVGPGGATIMNPTPEQARLATLSYLCETNNQILPPAMAFNWNWVDIEQRRDFDGVVAIERKTFAQFLRNQLAAYVSSNCYKPKTKLTQELGTTYWEWYLTPNQPPQVTVPDSGPMLLSFIHSAEDFDQAGAGGSIGRCKLRSEFTLTVSVQDNKITIDQNLIVWSLLRSLATETSGNIINRSITSIITLSVGGDGRLVVGEPWTNDVNSPDALDIDGFTNLFVDLNRIIDAIRNFAYATGTQNLSGIPIGLVQDFVFPGGRTFAFKDVGFSDHQDLVAHITYTTQQ